MEWHYLFQCCCDSILGYLENMTCHIILLLFILLSYSEVILEEFNSVKIEDEHKLLYSKASRQDSGFDREIGTWYVVEPEHNEYKQCMRQYQVSVESKATLPMNIEIGSKFIISNNVSHEYAIASLGAQKNLCSSNNNVYVTDYPGTYLRIVDEDNER